MGNSVKFRSVHGRRAPWSCSFASRTSWGRNPPYPWGIYWTPLVNIQKNYGKSPSLYRYTCVHRLFLWAMFNSYVKLPDFRKQVERLWSKSFVMSKKKQKVHGGVLPAHVCCLLWWNSQGDSQGIKQNHDSHLPSGYMKLYVYIYAIHTVFLWHRWVIPLNMVIFPLKMVIIYHFSKVHERFLGTNWVNRWSARNLPPAAFQHGFHQPPGETAGPEALEDDRGNHSFNGKTIGKP